jgi:hypothetical protein
MRPGVRLEEHVKEENWDNWEMRHFPNRTFQMKKQFFPTKKMSENFFPSLSLSLSNFDSVYIRTGSVFVWASFWSPCVILQTLTYWKKSPFSKGYKTATETYAIQALWFSNRKCNFSNLFFFLLFSSKSIFVSVTSFVSCNHPSQLPIISFAF